MCRRGQVTSASLLINYGVHLAVGLLPAEFLSNNRFPLSDFLIVQLLVINDQT